MKDVKVISPVAPAYHVDQGKGGSVVSGRIAVSGHVFTQADHDSLERFARKSLRRLISNADPLDLSRVAKESRLVSRLIQDLQWRLLEARVNFRNNDAMCSPLKVEVAPGWTKRPVLADLIETLISGYGFVMAGNTLNGVFSGEK